MPIAATAAVLSDPQGQFELRQIELDDPRDNEILIAVDASGVCHTDVMAKGMLQAPMVLGHEGTGIVEKIGSSVTTVKPGDRVVVSYPWCGECPECQSGHAYRCDLVLPIAFAGARLDGSQPISLDGTPISSAFFQQSSFATHAITLERDVVAVAANLKAEMLAAIPCGIQTGAGAVINSMTVKKGETIAIFGAGAVGLSAVMAAKLVGAATIIAVDRVESRLQLAQELGATHVINGGNGEVVQQIRDILPRGVNYSFDTTSNDQVLDDAIESLCMGGECGFVNAPRHGEKYPFNPASIFARAATLRGIIQGSALPQDFLPKLIDWQSQGLFPYEQLISKYDFADINKAFADSANGTAIKPVLIMP